MNTLTLDLIAGWDLEGNGNDIFNLNNTISTVSVTYGTVFGKIGQGAAFVKANNSHLLIPSLNFPVMGNGDFTVNYWVKKTSTGTYQFCVGQADGGVDTSTVSFIMGYDPTDKAFCWFSLNGTIINTLTNTVATIDNNWHMITMTRVGINGFLYFDSVQVATTSTLGILPITTTTNNFAIGTAGDASGSQHYSLDGDLDMIYIWKGIGLSQSSINTLYNNGNGLKYPFTISSNFLLFS